MDQEALEKQLYKMAQEIPYPPTPEIAQRVQRRLDTGGKRWTPVRAAAGVALIIVLLAAVLDAVPGVRAEIIRFLQVGVVRIFTAEPTPTPQSVESSTLSTATPISSSLPTPTYYTSLLDLAGETSLEEAQQKTDFPIRLPAYPSDLGPPERVFYQQDGPMVILV